MRTTTSPQESIWARAIDVPVLHVPACPWADRFADFSSRLMDQVAKKPSAAAFSHAKIRLLEEYFDYRAQAPRAHRGVGMEEDADHRCLFHAFEDAFRALKEAEWARALPALDPSPRAVSAPVIQPFDGIAFGSREPDPEFYANGTGRG